MSALFSSFEELEAFLNKVNIQDIDYELIPVMDLWLNEEYYIFINN